VARQLEVAPITTVQGRWHCEFYAVCTPPPARQNRRKLLADRFSGLSGRVWRVLFLVDLSTYERSLDRGHCISDYYHIWTYVL